MVAHAIVSMPNYYGLAKTLFGVDDLKLTEDQIASSFAQLILRGLKTIRDSSQKKESKTLKSSKTL